MMKEIQFHCETITPLFMAGAEGKTPELRSPAIKNSIRFWYRALNGYLNKDRLREAESQIFGGSDEKYGKNNVCIDVQPIPDGLSKDVLWNELPHNETEGIKYLLYSRLLLNRERPYLPANTPFTITVRAANREAMNKESDHFFLRRRLRVSGVLFTLGDSAAVPGEAAEILQRLTSWILLIF